MHRNIPGLGNKVATPAKWRQFLRADGKASAHCHVYATAVWGTNAIVDDELSLIIAR
jgi:hypothetical protein